MPNPKRRLAQYQQHTKQKTKPKTTSFDYKTNFLRTGRSSHSLWDKGRLHNPKRRLAPYQQKQKQNKQRLLYLILELTSSVTVCGTKGGLPNPKRRLASYQQQRKQTKTNLFRTWRNSHCLWDKGRFAHPKTTCCPIRGGKIKNNDRVIAAVPCIVCGLIVIERYEHFSKRIMFQY